MFNAGNGSVFFSEVAKKGVSKTYQALRDTIENNDEYQKEIMTINDMKEKLIQIRNSMSPEPIIAKLEDTKTSTTYGHARFIRVKNGIDGMRVVDIYIIKIELMKQSGTINYYEVNAQGNDKELKKTKIGNLPQCLGLDCASSTHALR